MGSPALSTLDDCCCCCCCGGRVGMVFPPTGGTVVRTAVRRGGEPGAEFGLTGLTTVGPDRRWCLLLGGDTDREARLSEIERLREDCPRWNCVWTVVAVVLGSRGGKGLLLLLLLKRSHVELCRGAAMLHPTPSRDDEVQTVSIPLTRG